MFYSKKCIFVVMTTLTVNIENKKSEKAVKAVLDALGLNYEVVSNIKAKERTPNRPEQAIYKRLKESLEQINLHHEGKIELRDAKDFLDEL
ncbi:hypothetical protein [Pedobacter sp. KBS0701]|uniref:hypothetical protein n=1 Tax=unclassified Pedobacter TaxID=2628915 RepID=UPI00110F3B56|nr:hypothetical protein [Pedobacter sp. KBS0701]QDW26897.1 hypothetical protein FFJ24_019535 [Pedobacter sp. KBS0701]